MKKITHHGFTMVELLIATSVFSVILLLAANGIVYVGRLYQKGASSIKAQEVTRSVVDEIKNDFELNGGKYIPLSPSGTKKGFCIGNNLYSYQPKVKIPSNGNRHALIVRKIPDCKATTPPDDVAAYPVGGARELLGPNMLLQNDDVISNVSANAKALTITITIVSAVENDLFDPATGLCKGGLGSQFCATSSLKTYAIKRVNTYN